MSEAEEARRHEFASQFNETDPWEEPILDYLSKQSHVRIADVLSDVLAIPIDRQTRREDQRVAAVLRRNGWRPDQRRIDGKKLRIWVLGSTPKGQWDGRDGGSE